MKKFSLTLFMTLFALLASASDIKVTQGKTSYLKSEGTMTVVFNWDNAKWDRGSSVKDEWAEQFESYKNEGEQFFIDGFNKASKMVNLSTENSTADYTMNVEFTNFDKFYSVMSLVPGHKHKVWANITVTDNKTGETVCTYKVTEFEGGRDFSLFDSYTEMMRDLGSKLAKK